MPIPLNIVVYERGAAGVPGTTFVQNLTGRITSYTHTISDRFGFESMSVSLGMRKGEALDWLQPGRLLRSALVTGPSGKTCWEGYLHTISARLGQKPQGLSMEEVGNRLRCKYTTVLDTPGTTATASETTSQGLYGIKDLVTTLERDTAAVAAIKRERVLARGAYPRALDAPEAATGAQGEITLERGFVGWYDTLGWLVTSESDRSTALNTTQVTNLLTDYNAVNAFFSSDVTNVVSSGSATPSQYIEADTTFRDAIEARLQLGDGAGGAYAWGVYENRMFSVQPVATSTTYYEIAGDANVYTASGLRVAPWDVRPNAVSTIRNILDPTPTGTTVDGSASRYIGRVSCSLDAETMRVSLETSESASVDAMLAAFKKLRSI